MYSRYVININFFYFILILLKYFCINEIIFLLKWNLIFVFIRIESKRYFMNISKIYLGIDKIWYIFLSNKIWLG